MEFRILGPVELQVNGRSYHCGSRKERCVLAILLWNLGQPVSADRLINLIWEENPPGSASENLYAYISRLRKIMKEASGCDRKLLVSRSGFYILDVDEQSVDLHQFRALRNQAKAVGDDEQAAKLLRDAVKLWRGTPLAGLTGEWAERARVKLIKEHLATATEWIAAELRLGRHAEVMGEISDLVGQDPYNEKLIEHQMTALYRSGRPAEALDAYHAFRSRLSEDLGTEPGSGLRDLHQRILNEDVELLAGTLATRSPPAPNNLPRDNPDFIGRETELDKLFSMINSDGAGENVTVVVISGMQGAGKSAFAIHAAHLLAKSYPQRLYIDMHAHHALEEPVDPASALGMLLRTLGVPPKHIPITIEESATMWRSLLADRRALIVIDDAGHPDQIKQLLPGAPGCLVLITCRRRMFGLSGMKWLHLDTLPEVEAMALLTRIVGVERTDDTTAAAEAVRLSGYLPLAIQIDGSRLRQHPTWSIADLVAQRSRGLHAGEIYAEDREIAQSLELSYRYLTSVQQRFFRQLALHPGGDFSVYAAAAITETESINTAARALECLFDHHLLEESEPGRFSFHDLIHGYAFSLAAMEGKESDTRNRIHRILDFYLCATERAVSVVYPFHRRIRLGLENSPVILPGLATRHEATRWVESERANIMSLTHYASRNGFWRHAGMLPHLLAQFLDTLGYWHDATALHRTAVRAWQDAGDVWGEARALTDLAFSLGRLGCFADALDCVRGALSIFRDRGDRLDEAEALDCKGLILWQASRYHEALSCHDEALAIWRTTQDLHGEADALGHGAMSLQHTRRFEEALRRMSKALAIYREIGDRGGEGKSLNNIADAQEHLGFHEEAFDRYKQALSISQEIGDRQGEAITLNNIGRVCQRTGRYDKSLIYYRKALVNYRAIGDRRCEADTLNGVGEVLQNSGLYEQAVINHQKALAMAHDIGDSYQEARSICLIGHAHLKSKKYASAAEDYQVVLELSKKIGDPYQEALALDGLGSVLLHVGGESAARERWQEALEIFERIGVPDAAAVRDRLRQSKATGS